jgi:UDP-N-acetylmuramyl pentapeptide synthase
MHEVFRKIVISILNWEAKKYLKKNNPQLIFVCGIINRSNTKEEVVRKLQAQGKNVRGSFKGYNAAIGLPLSILNLEAGYNSLFKWLKLLWNGLGVSLRKGIEPEVLVLEIALVNQQESQQISTNFAPNLVVFTDFEAKVSEESQILLSFKTFVAMIKGKGTVLLNSDYEKLAILRENSDCNFISIGIEGQPDILLNKICEQENITEFFYKTLNSEKKIELNKFGVQNIYASGIAEYLAQ